MTGVSIAAKIYGRIFGSGGDVPLALDSSGNVFMRGSQPATTAGVLTPTNLSVSASVQGYADVFISVQGTYAGPAVIYELSDDNGTTWYAAPYVHAIVGGGIGFFNNNGSNGNGTNATFAVRVALFGSTNVRIRATSGLSSGAANVRITPTSTAAPTGIVNAGVLGTTQPGATGIANGPALWLSSAGQINSFGAIGPYSYNGATWDESRSQEKITLLASAARTATTSVNLTNVQNCAVLVVVDVTARAASTTLTPSLVMGQGAGFVANKTVWTATAAINTASGTTMYVFWPFPTVVSPTGYAEVVSMPLFREMQLTVTHGDASSVTYSVTAYTAAV